MFDDEGVENRNDIRWVYATMSICHLALGNKDDYKKYRNLFESESEADWEVETFESTVITINKLNA